MTSIFRMLRPSPQSQLGPLEGQMLEALWRCGNATVRELIEQDNLKLAYTTVMTTLDRLYKKQLLDRVAEGRAFRYSPRYTPEQMQKAAAGEAIRQLLASDSPSSLPLSYLVEAVSEHDSQLLDDLQQLVERKRRELRGKERH
ncbi:MAG TPA: BlaI/MecI/CopY family transcriptional regulator [Terriglobales bacterium]|jgi:predicted transcriptional regulator|nr:BlaI/MecI/CopY family transcriptional regulator [Terriglobales bacterium]